MAFGEAGLPAGWWLSIPARTAGVAAVVWGAGALLTLEPRRSDAGPDAEAAAKRSEESARRLLVVLDVSPSMNLADAGPTGDQMRSTRAGELLLEVLRRVPLGQVRVTVVAFYTGGKPVAVDAVDFAVVENIFNALPLEQAFEPGPSELFKGLESAFELAKEWPRESTTLVIASDGDVVPATGMPKRPPSVGEVLVVGVGDPSTGSFIAGRQSRQDAQALRQIANRLGGRYVNGNRAPLPPDLLAGLGEIPAKSRAVTRDLRAYALAALAGGATLLVAVPVVLAFASARRSFRGTLPARSTG